MSVKYKIIIALVAVLTAFAFGRYSAPEKVKIETRTIEVEKKTTDTNKTVDRNKRLKTVTVIEERPDGTKVTTTTTTVDTDTKSNTDTATKDDIAKNTETTKETTRGGNRVTISALAGAKVSFSDPWTPVYGGMVNKELLGPITIGAFGLSDGVGGVALGLTF